VRDLDLTGLRARWHPVFRRKAPDHLPRHLLYRMIAYRLQAERLGDLDRDTAHFLDRVARDGNKLQAGPAAVTAVTASSARSRAIWGPSPPPFGSHRRWGCRCDLSRSGGVPAVAPAPLRSSDHQGNRYEQRNCHDEQKAARVQLG
jgi:Protein of unknown function (DUF2924)